MTSRAQGRRRIHGLQTAAPGDGVLRGLLNRIEADFDDSADVDLEWRALLAGGSIASSDC